MPSAQTYSDANRPTGAYTYDADGRMTARPGSSGGALEWDSLGRLARVRLTPGGTIVAAYTYDALDRLLTVDRAGTRIRFRYAGTTTAVAQVLDDTSGTVIRNVATGPEGTVLLDWLGADRRLYGTNGHHDTTWTADDTGAITATLRYDPWGNVIRSSGTLPDWRFQGSWADTATNLAWSVARWYDPVGGSFISEDTLLGEPQNPGSRHLYAYGAGEPLGSWDPGGGEPMSPQEWAIAARYPWHGAIWIRASFDAFVSNRIASMLGAIPARKENALRHCMWQCMIAANDSWNWAQTWGWMHEVFANDNNGPADTKVDYHNNYVGRLLGSKLGWLGGSLRGSAELCVEAWNRGWLFCFVKDRNGTRYYWSNDRRIYNPSSGPFSP